MSQKQIGRHAPGVDSDSNTLHDTFSDIANKWGSYSTEKYLDRTLIKAANLNELKRGDHIAWRRTYSIWHHAIVLDVKAAKGRIEIIHLSKKDVWPDTVQETEITACEEDGDLYRINYKSNERNTPEETIAIARQLAKKKKIYSILTNNCEHFVNMCVIGESKSNQVNRGVALTGAHTGLQIGAKSQLMKLKKNVIRCAAASAAHEVVAKTGSKLDTILTGGKYVAKHTIETGAKTITETTLITDGTNILYEGTCGVDAAGKLFISDGKASFTSGKNIVRYAAASAAPEVVAKTGSTIHSILTGGKYVAKHTIETGAKTITETTLITDGTNILYEGTCGVDAAGKLFISDGKPSIAKAPINPSAKAPTNPRKKNCNPLVAVALETGFACWDIYNLYKSKKKGRIGTKDFVQSTTTRIFGGVGAVVGSLAGGALGAISGGVGSFLGSFVGNGAGRCIGSAIGSRIGKWISSFF